MSIGLGIVGLGPAGATMLGAAFGHDQVSVVAVADTASPAQTGSLSPR